MVNIREKSSADGAPCILHMQARRNERLMTGHHTRDICVQRLNQNSSHRRSHIAPCLDSDWWVQARPTEGADLLLLRWQSCWRHLWTCTYIAKMCQLSSSTTWSNMVKCLMN